jgi:hypothetical protein
MRQRLLIALPSVREGHDHASILGRRDMAITYAGAQFLVNARLAGASFERTLTLGRQDLYVSPIRLTRLMKQKGLLADPAAFRNEITRWPYRADSFLEALGARELQFMDSNPYEGADVIHDLNNPVPDSLKEKYDLVLDGGTLEHVFNFPIALKSVMEMVSVGGHAIFLAPTNNYPGHGFYQLSPELYYQALSEENGYRVEQMLAIEDDLATSWILGRAPVALEAQRGAYEIPDPRLSGARVEFTTTRPAQLFVLASRLDNVPVLASSPQQALYRTLWEQAESDEAGSAPVSRSTPRALSPQGLGASLGLGAALHLVFGGFGRMLGPLRNLALARHYRSRRLTRQKRDIKPSDQIRT